MAMSINNIHDISQHMKVKLPQDICYKQHDFEHASVEMNKVFK